MKEFNRKEVSLQSETALALIRAQQHPIIQYGLYVGLDVHKETVAVSMVANDGSKPRYYGEIPHTPKAVEKLVKKLSPEGEVVAYCYEAGPCGYGLYRQITALSHDCVVVAPSLIPIKAGDRVKTDRRDSESLAGAAKV